MLLSVAFTKITPRPRAMMLYFSVEIDKKTRASTPADRRTCLNSNHVPGKTPSCPQGAISYFTISAGCYKQALPRNEDVGYERNRMRSRRLALGWKVCLKCVARAYSLTMQRFRIIPESITREPRALHVPSQREKFTDTPPHLMNDPQRSCHYYGIHIYVLWLEFHYCCLQKYRLKCKFRCVRGKVEFWICYCDLKAI